MSTRLQTVGADARAAQIIETVLGIIERDGYDAAELRRVARDAHVSLSTIYNHFPSRDALLLAALEHWMEVHVYRPIPAPDPAAPIADQFVGVLRHVFEPWLEHHRMLHAFLRVREGPDGSQLKVQGFLAAQPVIRAAFDQGIEPDEFQEIMLVSHHVVYSVMWQYARGRMEADAVLPVLETTVRRLVASLGRVAPENT